MILKQNKNKDKTRRKGSFKAVGQNLHAHFTTDGISQLQTTRSTLLLRREATPVPPSSGGLILLWRSPSWSLHRCVRQYRTQVGCRLLSQLMPVGLPLVAKQSRANERILVKSATRDITYRQHIHIMPSGFPATNACMPRSIHATRAPRIGNLMKLGKHSLGSKGCIRVLCMQSVCQGIM